MPLSSYCLNSFCCWLLLSTDYVYHSLFATVCHPLYVAVCRLRKRSDDVGTSRYEPPCPVDVRPERAVVAAVVFETQTLENQ